MFKPTVDDFLEYFNEMKKAMERGYRYCVKLDNSVFEIHDMRYEVAELSGEWRKYIGPKKDLAFYSVYLYTDLGIPIYLTAHEFIEKRLNGKIGLCEDLRTEE